MADGEFKPGVAAIIIIAIGILIFTLLFIFTKRQIMRLAQKFPTNDPQSAIGYAAPKDLFRKIDNRLNAIKNIRYEPVLIHPDNEHSCEKNESIYKHIYRMKAVDTIKDLEDYIVNSCGKDESKRRCSGQNLRVYLLNLQKDNGPLMNCDLTLINSFVDSYFHARFEAEPEFGSDEYNRYVEMYETIKSQIVQQKLKTSPAKVVNRKISKGITTNLSFKNLTALSSTSKDNFKVKNDETCV